MMAKKLATTSVPKRPGKRGMIWLSKGRLFPLAIIVVMFFASTGWSQTTSILEVLHNLESPDVALNNNDGVLETVEGVPETTRVNLTLSANGGQGAALDLVLVLDRSATADTRFLQEIGKSFFSALGANGRIALVSFAEFATVDVELTSSSQLFLSGLEQLRNIGKTAVGDGLFAATQHFLQRGRESALWIAVLITDGRANAGRDPRLQAQRAADNGIQIFTVGVGRNLNESMLRDIAQTAGGSFFREFGFAVVDEILERTELTVVVRDITIVETLAQGIVYEQALLNPPERVNRTPFGTTLEWTLSSLAAGEQWTTSFTVSATREGSLTLNQAPSEITYTDFRGQRVSEPLPVLQLNVLPAPLPNELPSAHISFTPGAPSTQRDVEFTGTSADTDGQVVSYFWEFGDGFTSSAQNPTHRYAEDGTYTVTLTVTDDRGGVQSTTQMLVVSTKKINVVRTIDTFLPTDITLPGETFRVTLEIEINALINGMGVNENINESIPEGWTITPISNAGARFKELNTPTKELQWVFLEVLEPGATRTVIYDVTVPHEMLQQGVFVFKGIVTSVSPDVESKISGDGQVEIRGSLPIETVISRWDTRPNGLESESVDGAVFGRLNLHLSNKITFEQVQVAIGWWLNDTRVPNTGNEQIDFITIQSIIARWLTGTPIHKTLPGETET